MRYGMARPSRISVEPKLDRAQPAGGGFVAGLDAVWTADRLASGGLSVGTAPQRKALQTGARGGQPDRWRRRQDAHGDRAARAPASSGMAPGRDLARSW